VTTVVVAMTGTSSDQWSLHLATIRSPALDRTLHETWFRDLGAGAEKSPVTCYLGGLRTVSRARVFRSKFDRHFATLSWRAVLPFDDPEKLLFGRFSNSLHVDC
jgi:hypothetical protein